MQPNRLGGATWKNPLAITGKPVNAVNTTNVTSKTGTKPTFGPAPPPPPTPIPAPYWNAATVEGSSRAGVQTKAPPTPEELAAAQVAEQQRQVAAAEAAQAAKEAQARAEEQAYWDDQLKYADQSLGRLGGQRQTGYNNLEGSYQSGLTSLNNSRSAAQQRYSTTRKDTTDDNILARAAVDDGVRSQFTGLQRLLGSRGAGLSRSAQRQAGYAAATQGNQRRQQVQRTFGRNLRDLDNNWKDKTTEFDNSLMALDTDKRNKKNELDNSFAQTEAELVQKKSDAAFQKAQAGGQTYTQARTARVPYDTRIKALMAQMDALGTNVNLTPKAVQYTAPSLQEYGFDRFAAPTASAQPAPGMGVGTGAYWNLGRRDEEKQRV